MARLPAIVDVFRRDYTETDVPLVDLAARYGCDTTTLYRLIGEMRLPKRPKLKCGRKPGGLYEGTEADKIPDRISNAMAFAELLARLRELHPLPPRAARDVPVGASWAFTDHRTCAEWV